MADIVQLKETGKELARVVRKCGNCLAWRPKKNQQVQIFGGCEHGGRTTTHYGDTHYNHYTTDLQICSAWEQK